MSYSKEEFLVRNQQSQVLCVCLSGGREEKTSPKHIGHANTGDIIMTVVFFGWNQSLSQGGGNNGRLQTPVNFWRGAGLRWKAEDDEEIQTRISRTSAGRTEERCAREMPSRSPLPLKREKSVQLLASRDVPL